MATFGYLEGAYLVASYLSQLVTEPYPMQIGQQIISSAAVNTQMARLLEKTNAIPIQVNRRIETNLVPILSQTERTITNDFSIPSQVESILAVSDSINMQMERQIDVIFEINSQAERRITDDLPILSQLQRINAFYDPLPSQMDRGIDSGNFAQNDQLDLKVISEKTISSQLERRIESSSLALSQMEPLISAMPRTNSEMGRGPVSHELCGGYLIDAYLINPYLAPQICAHLRQQMTQRLAKISPIHSQMGRRLQKTASLNQQVERKIFSQSNIRFQLLRQASYKLQTQLLRAIYNTTNLRILCDFPSRGTSGTNWTVVAGGTTPGDFNINNVNTDIVEQAYRSTNTSVTIQCDTQISQGIFNDTLAILAHNMSRSASVTLQGSNDVTFSSIALSETLNVEEENIYWISEFLPLSSYRYWRIVASDPTNADGYIQMGTIVFGPSIIFNGECFVDTVMRRKTHFADRIRTEGYSAVSNDRALKRAVGLSFQKLNFSRENYGKLSGVIDYARTSLKCLWIPTPQTASRFSVFGKLSEMPVETHKAISATADYIDLDVNIDEAL